MRVPWIWRVVALTLLAVTTAPAGAQDTIEERLRRLEEDAIAKDRGVTVGFLMRHLLFWPIAFVIFGYVWGIMVLLGAPIVYLMHLYDKHGHKRIGQ